MSTFYLSSPNSQVQAAAVADMPVLLSFACYSPWLDKYQHSFRRILIDSGAFSMMNSNKQVDGGKYRDWHARWTPHADAIAGLDDIMGDWRKSLYNYERFGGFPTFHDTDPPELLDDLIELARQRGSWIGLGLKPPRHAKEHWVRAACDRIPDDLHIHGWALGMYSGVRRIDSFDSTNWFNDAMKYRSQMPWLTYAETLEIVVKRYVREPRMIVEKAVSETTNLFSEIGE